MSCVKINDWNSGVTVIPMNNPARVAMGLAPLDPDPLAWLWAGEEEEEEEEEEE